MLINIVKKAIQLFLAFWQEMVKNSSKLRGDKRYRCLKMTLMETRMGHPAEVLNMKKILLTTRLL
jgi:hypothetical protein